MRDKRGRFKKADDGIILNFNIILFFINLNIYFFIFINKNKIFELNLISLYFL